VSDDRDIVVTLTEAQARCVLDALRPVVDASLDAGVRQDADRVIRKIEKTLADRDAKRRMESASSAALKRTLKNAREGL
jgi:hypothetical protein